MIANKNDTASDHSYRARTDPGPARDQTDSFSIRSVQNE